MTKTIQWREFWTQVEKHELAPTLFEVGHLLTPKQYWTEVGDAWERCESHYRQMILWEHLLKGELLHGTQPLEERRWMTDKESRKRSNALRKEPWVRVWRGGRQNGWSWTTDEEKARWFAERCPVDGIARLCSCVVRGEAIIATRDGRGESEVILDPSVLNGVIIEDWEVETPTSSKLAQAIQSHGHKALFGSYYVQGQQRGMLTAMHSDRAVEDQVLWLKMLRDYCAEIEATTVYLRVSEYLRGVEDGISEYRASRKTAS